METGVYESPQLSERISAHRATIGRVVDTLKIKLHALGLRQFDSVLEQGLGKFELREDPFDKTESLCGQWLNAHSEHCGNLQILGSGQVFAEFDVLLDHPTDKRWFIESVTAWGQGSNLRSDFQLLAVLGA